MPLKSDCRQGSAAEREEKDLFFYKMLVDRHERLVPDQFGVDGYIRVDGQI